MLKNGSFLADNTMKLECQAISPYLTSLNASAAVVEPKAFPSEGMPAAVHGTILLDGGALTVSESDAERFKGCPWLKRLVGADEMLYGRKRWCLYLVDVQDEEIARWPQVLERVEQCRRNRERMVEGKSCRSPKEFRDRVNPKLYAAIPLIVARKRPYIPVDVYGGNDIPTFQLIAFPDADSFLCGILMSKASLDWTTAIGSKFGRDHRYSISLCCNAFPWPDADEAERIRIGLLAQNVFSARKKHPELCLDSTYDPETMPRDVLEAHLELDEAVDRLYRLEGKPRIQRLLEEYSARHQKDVCSIDRFL